MVVDVVGAERLLDPIGVVILVDAHEAQRRRQVRPRVVGIEHQDDFGTDRVARGGDAGALLARIGMAADLDLDRLEAELDVASDLDAELLRRLAGQIVTVRSTGRAALGRSLSTRVTGQVGVIVSELANPFYMETIAHLYDALDRAGYRTVVLTEPPDRPVAPEQLLDGALDGAILTTTLLDSALPEALARRGFPLVLLNRRIDALVCDTCVSANAAGAAAIGELLVELGHTRVGALFGPADTSASLGFTTSRNACRLEVFEP